MTHTQETVRAMSRAALVRFLGWRSDKRRFNTSYLRTLALAKVSQ